MRFMRRLLRRSFAIAVFLSALFRATPARAAAETATRGPQFGRVTITSSKIEAPVTQSEHALMHKDPLKSHPEYLCYCSCSDCGGCSGCSACASCSACSSCSC